MIKAALKFIDYMELKYRISIPKEPLIEFAKKFITLDLVNCIHQMNNLVVTVVCLMVLVTLT